jgi:hypothetical protein
MMKYPLKLAAALAALISAAPPAHAVLIGGVEFPQGAISFADAVGVYEPGLQGLAPTAPFRLPGSALGAPDFTNATCTAATCEFVSLGVGGRLSLRFVDNLLTGSDSNAADLWVFEIGEDVEDTTVEVSVDGVNWLSVGSVGGSISGVDLDAFGYGSTSVFSWVRLQDVAAADSTTGITVGADIDAVGAISTIRAPGVPEPTTWALMLLGVGALGAQLRLRRRSHAGAPTGGSA